MSEQRFLPLFNCLQQKHSTRTVSYRDMCSLSLATVRQNKQGAAHKEETIHHQQPNPDPTQLTFRPKKHYPVAISAIFAGTRELIKQNIIKK